MNYTTEAWEEEQMSNLGCESVADLIAEVIRLRGEYNEIKDALVGDSLNWTHDELCGRALELSNLTELEFGEWHTDEGESE